MIDHRNALNLLAVQIVQWKIVRQKAANMCLKASEKTSADPAGPLPPSWFKPAETLRCPSKKWSGHNGRGLPVAWKPVKLQIFPIVTNARSMWRPPLPTTEIRSSGDGLSLNWKLCTETDAGEVRIKEGWYWCYCPSKCSAINVWWTALPIKTYGWHSLKMVLVCLKHWNIIC